jgi:DNA-binding MarR family transcriptional regulator
MIKNTPKKHARPLRDIYFAFANWRSDIQSTTKVRRSIFFFRRSFDHSLIWMLVMRGYYGSRAPSVRECLDAAKCSRLTTRKLLADAVARGYLEIRPAPDDHRKRLVHPTRITIAEYEAMVRRYLGLWDTLLKRDTESSRASAGKD